LNRKAVRIASIASFLSLSTVAGLFFPHSNARGQQKAKEKGGETTYYTHGRIYTNDPESPWADALAVADGKISCIGKLDHVLLDCGGSQEGAVTVNFKGHFVMPGFNDAHVHLGGAAADLLAVPLIGVPSPEEM
jgi:hypothetical protein